MKKTHESKQTEETACRYNVQALKPENLSPPAIVPIHFHRDILLGTEIGKHERDGDGDPHEEAPVEFEQVRLRCGRQAEDMRTTEREDNRQTAEPHQDGERGVV